MWRKWFDWLYLGPPTSIVTCCSPGPPRWEFSGCTRWSLGGPRWSPQWPIKPFPSHSQWAGVHPWTPLLYQHLTWCFQSEFSECAQRIMSVWEFLTLVSVALSYISWSTDIWQMRISSICVNPYRPRDHFQAFLEVWVGQCEGHIYQKFMN
jgi:hypothetical protein